MRWLALLPLLVLCACAAKQVPQEMPARLFVILPDNYVIDLAAGSQVIIDPSAQEFALFPTSGAAAKALAAAAPNLPGSWGVFEIADNPAEIARPRGSGEYVLIKPAQVLEWVETP